MAIETITGGAGVLWSAIKTKLNNMFGELYASKGFESSYLRHIYTGVSEPSAQDSVANTFGPGDTRVYGASCDYADIVALWDYFTSLTIAGLTIAKANLGTDESGTLQLHSYTFTPDYYDRTVMIVSGHHGEEISSMLGLWRFFYRAIGYTGTDKSLLKMRNTRYVIIPCVNPWGLNNSRDHNNVNGVDLVQNYGYNWTDYVSATKGSAASSEAETVIVRDLFLSVSPVAVIDCHDYVGSAGTTFPGYVPYWEIGADPAPVLAAISAQCVTNDTTSIYGSLESPLLTSWAASQGAAAFLCECGALTNTYLDADYMTRQVAWIGGIITAYSHAEKGSVVEKSLVLFEATKVATKRQWSGYLDYRDLTDRGDTAILATDAPIANELGNFRLKYRSGVTKKLNIGWDNTLGSYYIQAVNTGTGKLPLLFSASKYGFNKTGPTGFAHFKSPGSAWTDGWRLEQSADTTYYDLIHALNTLYIGHNGTAIARFDEDGFYVINAGGADVFTAKRAAPFKFLLSVVPAYANNAAAISGGLVAGNIYRTNGDPDTLCIVH